MNTITEAYRELNRQLHTDNETYGTGGHKWADMIGSLATEMKTTDVLDYGCGKQTLRAKLPYVVGYDPCLAGLDEQPLPSDLVVCTDVLEHIEPDCLEFVFDDLVRVTGCTLFAVVATRHAEKTLADGRNAHLIIEDAGWWMRHFFNRFNVQSFHNYGLMFVVIANTHPIPS